jgi:transcriptional regulator with XRE-family HTH domain
MNIQENISNNLKQYRREIGLSQEALAERLGVTSQAVSKWECMQSIPDIDAIVALCELLGITTDKLLLDRDPEVVYQKEEIPGERVEVNICETGFSISNPGAEPLDRNRLFQRFYQPGGRKEGSSGLGLALVYSVCERNGFSVSYDFRETRHIFSVNLKNSK